MNEEAASAPTGLPCLRRRPRMVFGAHIHVLGARIHQPDNKPWKKIETEDLGGSVRLALPEDWPIHNQGQRGACVAHAAVACLEYFVFSQTGRLIPFSEQFIHYTMRQQQYREGNFSDRNWLKTASEVLPTRGICLARIMHGGCRSCAIS
jgi:hypothetical protein